MATLMSRVRLSAWRPMMNAPQLRKMLQRGQPPSQLAACALSERQGVSGALASLLVPRRCYGDFSDAQEEYTNDYFRSLVENKPLVLFMKGDPSAPMCGFSRLVVQILHMHGMDGYDYYDVLDDINFKEGMKKFSQWPTFPQLYINGELLGGADIVLQLHQSGELVTELERIGHHSALLESGPDSTP